MNPGILVNKDVRLVSFYQDSRQLPSEPPMIPESVDDRWVFRGVLLQFTQRQPALLWWKKWQCCPDLTPSASSSTMLSSYSVSPDFVMDLLGVLSELKKATPEVQEFVDGLSGSELEKENIAPGYLQATHFKSQVWWKPGIKFHEVVFLVVAGTNYFVRVRGTSGNHFHFK